MPFLEIKTDQQTNKPTSRKVSLLSAGSIHDDEGGASGGGVVDHPEDYGAPPTYQEANNIPSCYVNLAA